MNPMEKAQKAAKKLAKLYSARKTRRIKAFLDALGESEQKIIDLVSATEKDEPDIAILIMDSISDAEMKKIQNETDENLQLEKLRASLSKVLVCEKVYKSREPYEVG